MKSYLYMFFDTPICRNLGTIFCANFENELFYPYFLHKYDLLGIVRNEFHFYGLAGKSFTNLTLKAPVTSAADGNFFFFFFFSEKTRLAISCELSAGQTIHCLQRQGIFGFSRTRVNALYFC